MFCMSSNQEAVVSAEMKGMKVYEVESGQKGSREKLDNHFIIFHATVKILSITDPWTEKTFGFQNQF